MRDRRPLQEVDLIIIAWHVMGKYGFVSGFNLVIGKIKYEGNDVAEGREYIDAFIDRVIDSHHFLLSATTVSGQGEKHAENRGGSPLKH